MTRIAYLEPFAGASGDMLLGALLDAGWPMADLQAVVRSFAMPGVTVEARRVQSRHLTGTQVSVHAPEAQPLRHPADLVAVIDRAAVGEAVKARARAVILRLAEVEAHVHGIPVEEVHFHEVGAVDTLVDVVGVIAGFAALGVEKIISAPLPWSQGAIRIAHGVFPVPPPAVAALLEGFPVKGVEVEGEMVTPTGAALITGLADAFGAMPDLTVRRVAYGAGTRAWPDRPNVLRLVLGDAPDEIAGMQQETLTVLACNLDDMVAEWYGPLVESALQAGALDVWLVPVQMKKNRPAVVVEVLCRPVDAPGLRELLFDQTTTLGVREYPVTRYALSRDVHTVSTPYGPVRIKIARPGTDRAKFAPEHEDCAARAAEHGVSVRAVWLAAVAAAREVLSGPR
ncbi:MAG: nickel pincer cofactor biosynthesis protein LarC [Anaerolineae bacterium]